MRMSEIKSNTERNKKSISWLYAVLFIIAVSIIITIYRNRDLKVKSVEFIGNYYTQTEQLNKVAGIDFEENPDSLNYDEIIGNLKNLAYIKEIQLFVEPNGSLRFNVEERQPIALLLHGEKRSYVDKDGVQLPIIKGKTQNVPLVYGFSAENYRDTLKSRSFEQIRDLLIAAKENEFGWATLSELTYSKNDGVIALSHENGVKLIFGEHDFETKLENWEAFYGEIVREKGINKIQQVDLRFLNQVVTREL